MTDQYTDFSEDIASALSDDKQSVSEEAKTEESADPKAKATEEKSGGEEVRTWQSKADSAEARANKAEQELAAFKAASAKETTEAVPSTVVVGSVDPWVEASKGNFRDDLYKSDPRLAQLNLSPDLIRGGTPTEMKKSFDDLQTAVNKMETGVRNRVLIEHGLQPVPGAGDRATGVNYENMPKEEFDKVVADALSG